MIRHAIAWANNPDGGYTVDYHRPISFSGKTLAKCRVRREEMPDIALYLLTVDNWDEEMEHAEKAD